MRNWGRRELPPKLEVKTALMLPAVQLPTQYLYCPHAMSVWDFDSSRPVAPSSPTEFGGIVDPQLALSNFVLYCVDALGLKGVESSIEPHIAAVTPAYFQGMT